MKIPVLLDGRLPFVRLQLLDATLSNVLLPHAYGDTTVELAPGAYIAVFQTSAWRWEHAFLVLPDDRTRTVAVPAGERPLVDGAAPAAGVNTFLAADAAMIEEVSRRQPSTVAGAASEGRLMIAIRKRPLAAMTGPPEAAPLPPTFRESIELWTADGRRVGLDACWQGDDAIACASLALPGGAYELRLSTDARRHFLSQFVFVVPGLQTQVFAVDRSPATVAAPWGAAKVSVHFADAGEGFRPDSPSAAQAEELLNILAEGGIASFGPVHASELADSDAPLVRLAFWLSQWCDDVAASNGAYAAAIRELCRHLSTVPDPHLLQLLAEGPRGAIAEVRHPPLLSRAWDLVLHGENRRLLQVMPGSAAARVGPMVLGGGAWLRFRVPPADVAGNTTTGTNAPTGSSGVTFEALAHVFDRLATQELSARVHFNSTHLTLVERRLLGLICPRFDTLRCRIAEKARTPIAAAVPGEDEAVLALGLPRASIALVATAAVEKLTRATVLPTESQLDDFVRAELAADIVVRDPLNSLRRRPSHIWHVLEHEPLPLLALVYLFYGVDVAEPGSEPARRAVAVGLNRLGFARRDGGEPVTDGDIAAALRQAAEHLERYYELAGEVRRPVWEAVRIQLVPRDQYRPGNLCVVERSSVAAASADIEKHFWEVNGFAYFPSLWTPAGAVHEGGRAAVRELRTRGVTRAEYFDAVTRTALDPKWNW